MAEISLFEIAQNDERPDIIRKVNANFKNLGYAQAQKIKQASLAGSDDWKKALEDYAEDQHQQFANVGKRLTTDETKIAKLEEENKKLQKKIEQAKLEAWPVGSIYSTSLQSQPDDILGGTWTKVADKAITTDNETAGTTIHIWVRTE